LLTSTTVATWIRALRTLPLRGGTRVAVVVLLLLLLLLTCATARVHVTTSANASASAGLLWLPTRTPWTPTTSATKTLATSPRGERHHHQRLTDTLTEGVGTTMCEHHPRRQGEQEHVMLTITTTMTRAERWWRRHRMCEAGTLTSVGTRPTLAMLTLGTRCHAGHREALTMRLATRETPSGHDTTTRWARVEDVRATTRWARVEDAGTMKP
jgi:hypothetical protein